MVARTAIQAVMAAPPAPAPHRWPRPRSVCPGGTIGVSTSVISPLATAATQVRRVPQLDVELEIVTPRPVRARGDRNETFSAFA
jgi:hypothetical protein